MYKGQKFKFFFIGLICSGIGFPAFVFAGVPLWTFSPLTPTTVSVSDGEIVKIKYRITNNSHKTHNLVVKDVLWGNVEPYSCNLSYQQSCEITIDVDGSKIGPNGVSGGPVVCSSGSTNLQCYQPSQIDSVKISKSVAAPSGTGSVTQLSSDLSPRILIGAGVATNSSNSGSGTTGIVSVDVQTPFANTVISGMPITINAGGGLSGNIGQVTSGSTSQGSTTNIYDSGIPPMVIGTVSTPGTTINQVSNVGTGYGTVGISLANTDLNAIAGVSTLSNSGQQQLGITTGLQIAHFVLRRDTQVALTYTNTQVPQSGMNINSVGVSVRFSLGIGYKF